MFMQVSLQYSTNPKRGRTDIKQHTAWAGNNLKAMNLSVEESLKKLRTSYIDILYVHWVRRQLILAHTTRLIHRKCS